MASMSIVIMNYKIRQIINEVLKLINFKEWLWKRGEEPFVSR